MDRTELRSMPAPLKERYADQPDAALVTLHADGELGGRATANGLAAPFELTLPAVSKHIKVLERAGLVVRGQHAQYRPCALDASPIEAVSMWAEQYRPVWEARLDRMDEYLRRLQSDQTGGRA